MIRQRIGMANCNHSAWRRRGSCGRPRRHKASRSIDHVGTWHPVGGGDKTAAAERRTPHPAIAINPRPSAVAIWQPSPRVWRNPRPPRVVVVIPVAGVEWAPVRQVSIVRLPHHSVARHVERTAVVSEVRHPVLVSIIKAFCVALAILLAILAPVVVRSGFDVVGKRVASRVVQVQRH